jgi:hypothetical protein
MTDAQMTELDVTARYHRRIGRFRTAELLEAVAREIRRLRAALARYEGQPPPPPAEPEPAPAPARRRKAVKP